MDKRIEEMTKETCGQQIYPYGKDRPICWLTKEDCTCRVDNQCDHYEVCERIYNAGYRKIPEGAVVLTNDQKIWLEHEWYKLGYKQGIKEMVEKLAKRLKGYLKESYHNLYHAEYRNGMVSINLGTLIENIDEICKELEDK